MIWIIVLTALISVGVYILVDEFIIDRIEG
jgi:hypothetical protein